MTSREKFKVYFTDSEVLQLLDSVDPMKLKFWKKIFGTNYATKGYELNDDMIEYLSQGISRVTSSDILDDEGLEALKGKIEQLSLMRVF